MTSPDVVFMQTINQINDTESLGFISYDQFISQRKDELTIMPDFTDHAT
jgi:hypothetical protein